MKKGTRMASTTQEITNKKNSKARAGEGIMHPRKGETVFASVCNLRWVDKECGGDIKKEQRLLTILGLKAGPVFYQLKWLLPSCSVSICKTDIIAVVKS